MWQETQGSQRVARMTRVARAARRGLAGVALAGLLALGACGVGGFGGGTRGSGNLKTETRPVSGFTTVALSGAGNLIIQQTGSESLTITAEDNLLPLLTSTVQGGTLMLGQKAGASITPTRPINYVVTVKSLNGVSLAGAGNITANGIQTNALTVSLSGAGRMSISGAAASQMVNISGLGNYSAQGFQTGATQITISGAGSATVSASQTLDATISGAGNITYYGSPQVTQHVSGAGSIKRG